MQPNIPERRTATASHKPRRKASPARAIVPALFLFLGLLTAMYFAFPKVASRRTEASRYDGLVISEVMSTNAAAVPDERGEFPDWVELYNGTGADLNLEGVIIANRNDRIAFPFPSYWLEAEGRVIVFASDRYQLEPDKPFHGRFKIPSAGATLSLYSPEVRLIDQLTVPILTADNSYHLANITSAGKKEYEVTPRYSPGHPNGDAGFLAYRSSSNAAEGALLINEVCPNPRLGIPDVDGEIVDWLELRNTTNEPISLQGYFLSDKEHKPTKWRFPEHAVIPPNGYYLVYCSGKDKPQENGVPHTNFSISAAGETLLLSNRDGHLLDRVAVKKLPEDHSLGRNGAGDWESFAVASPGYSNDPSGQNKADELLRACNPSGVYITEVMTSNDVTAIGVSATITDYVELYNAGSQRVDLSLYGLSDSLNRPRKWQFPQGAAIDPGEHKIILLDGRPELSSGYAYHANFRIARAGGESISFCDPTGRVLDRIPLPLIPTDHSYGRTSGYAGFYYYDAPTPGTANGVGYYGYAEPPAFSRWGGESAGAVQVGIAVPKDTEVHYTLDGTLPTENAPRYQEGHLFDISRATVLRACAFDRSGLLQPSETITQTYLPGLYHAFPIVSLVADPSELWDPDRGMLTAGPDVDKSRGIPFKNTIYRMVKEKLTASPGHVEIYDKMGSQLVSQGMEFSLQGQNSLDFPQKSFKVKAKARHDAKYFAAKLFEDRPFTEYKGFVLRISGNDSAWTRLIDGFQGRLIDRFNEKTSAPSTVIHQAWNPVVVYLNGTYWGHYNLRERVDRFFVAQHESLPLGQADNMDILEASGSVDYGSNKEYRALIAEVKALSPGKSEADLQFILDHIDVNNYFDYMAFEMFFGNSDPGNIRFYKLKGEGQKWKWILYDLDYGLFDSGFNSPYSYLKEKGAGDKLIDNTLIRKLLENGQMRDDFLTRLGEVYQFFTTEYMTAEFNGMVAEIEPEMALHFARWAEETDKAVSFDNPTTPDGALRYWHERLNRTRNTLKKRPTYFYEMVQKQFQLSSEQMLSYFGEKPPLPADANADYIEGEKWR